MIKKTIIIIVFFLAARCISGAAGKTWTFSGAGNWNNASNWNPAGAPASDSDVVIDIAGASVSMNATLTIPNLTLGNTNNCTLIFSSNELTITHNLNIGPSGFIGHTAGNLTLSGDINISARSTNPFNPGTAGCVFKFSNSVSTTAVPAMNISTWYFEVNSVGMAELSGDLICRKATISGALKMNSYNMVIKDRFLLNSLSNFIKGTGKIILSGGIANYLVFNKDTDIGEVQISGNTTGVLNPNGNPNTISRITIDSGCEFRSDYAGKTLMISDAAGITVNGALNLKDCVIMRSSGNFALTNNGTVNLTLASIKNCSPVNVTIDATNGCTDLGGNDPKIIFSPNDNPKTWNVPSGNWSTGANWINGMPDSNSQVYINSGAADNASGAVGNLSLNNCSLSLSGDLTINNNLTVGSGVTINSGANKLIVKKNVISSALILGSGSLKISGGIPQNISWNAPDWNLQLNNTSGYSIVSSAPIICRDCTVDSNVTFISNYGINCTNYNLSISSTVFSNANITISKDAGISGTFTPSANSTIIFNSGGLQVLTDLFLTSIGNTKVMNSNTTLSLASSAKFANLAIDSGTCLKCVIPNSDLMIYDGCQVTVDGTLMLSGTSWETGNNVRLKTAGGPFLLYKTGTLSLTYVDLSNCSVIGSALNLSGVKVNNKGGSYNIIFPPRSWKSGSMEWSYGTWDPPGQPATLDNVFIDGNVTVTNASGTFSSLNLSNGCVLSMTMNPLNLSGDLTIASGCNLTSANYLNVGGNVEISGSVSGISYLTLNGKSNQSLKWPGNSWNISISNSSGATVSLTNPANLSCNNLSVGYNSTFNPNNKNIILSGNLISDGNLLSSTGTLSFNTGVSTATNRTLKSNDNSLGDMRIDSVNTTVNMISGARFQSLYVVSSSILKNFMPGVTITIDNTKNISVEDYGSFVLSGASGNNIVLQSAAAPSQFTLTRQANSAVSMAYVSVIDCNANPLVVYISPTCSTTRTTNISVSAAYYAKTWVAGGDSKWTSSDRWTPSGVPDVTNDVYINLSGTTVIYDISSAVASLNISGNGLFRIDGSFGTLTINGLLSTGANCTLGFNNYDQCIAGKGMIDIKGPTKSDEAQTKRGTLKYSGSLLQGISWTGNTNWSITVDNGNLVSLCNNFSCRDFTVNSNCNFTQGTGTLTVCRDMTLNGNCTIGGADVVITGGLVVGGTLTQTGTGILSVPGNTTIGSSAKFSQGGGITYLGADLYLNSTGISSFVKGSGKLLFNRGNLQIFNNSVSDDLGNIQVSGSNTLVSLNNNIRFTNLTIDANAGFKNIIEGKTITVTNNGSITVNGTLTLVGSSSATTILTTDNPTAGSAKFTLTTNILKTSISYVGIRNCSPVSGKLDATNNCYNLLGNDTSNIYFSLDLASSTWQGGALGNWDNAANWSSGSTPSPNHNLVINTANTQITNASGVVYSITFLNSANLTLSGDLIVNSMLSAATSGPVTINSGSNNLYIKGNTNLPNLAGSGNYIISNSTAPVNLKFDGPNWNIQNSNSYTVTTTGSLTCKNLTTDTSSNLSIGGDLNIRGNCSLNGSFYEGSGTTYFNGGILQTLSGNTILTTNLGNVRVSSSNTTLSLLGNLCADNLVVDNGTFFKDTTPGTTITISNDGNLSVNGTFTLEGTSWGTSSVYLKSLMGYARFNFIAVTPGLSYVSMTGCNAVGATLDLSAKKVNNLGNNANIKFPARSWVGGTADWTNGGINNWEPPALPNSMDNVVIDKAGARPQYANGSINSLTIGIANASTIEYTNGFLNILGKEGVTVGQYGKFIVDSNDTQLNVKGNVYATNPALSIMNLTLSGNTDQTLRWPGSITNDLVISNTSAIVTLENTSTETLLCHNITTNTGSTLQISSKTVEINGNIDFSGTVLANANTILIFDSNGGSQSISASNNDLGQIIIDTGDPKTVNLTSNIKFSSLTINSDVTLKAYTPGTTITVYPPNATGISLAANSAFLFAGSYDERSVLKSTAAANFKFTRDTLALTRFAYVDISYCDASSGGTVFIPDNCTKSSTVKIEYDSYQNAKTWIGNPGDDWTIGSKWSPAGAPEAINDVIIAGGQISNASGQIASMTCTGQASITINDLTVNGHCTIASSSTLKGGDLHVKGNLFAQNINSSGYLYINGKSFQAINWQGESWNVVVSNASGSGVSSVAPLACYQFTINPGVKYYQGGSDLLVASNAFINASGTFSQDYPGDVSIGVNVNVGSNVTVSIGRDLFVGLNFTMSGSTNAINLSLNDDSFTSIGGNCNLNSGIFSQNHSQVLINGDLNVNGVVYNNGNQYLSVMGNVSIASAFNQGSGRADLYGASIVISKGVFNKGAGKIRFVRPGNQVLTAGSNNLGNIEVSGIATVVSLADSAEFASLLVETGTSFICKTGNTAVTLADTTIKGYAEFSASKFTMYVAPKPDPGIKILSGKLIMMGTRDDGTKNYLSLLSKQSGSQFSLSADDRNNISVKYAKIMDCDASLGDNVEAAMSIDLGNNKNIYFGSQPPAMINDLKIRQTVGSGQVKIGWTAVGLEGKVGRSTSYIIKYSAVNITNQSHFDASNEYTQNLAPLFAGNQESYTLTGLTGSDIWYVGVEAKNFAGLQGDLSQITEYVLVIDPAKPVSFKVPGERNNVSLEIPAGTFGTNVELSGKEQTDAEMPRVTGQPEFRSTGLGTALSVYPAQRFKQPVKLSIKYNAEDVQGLSEDKLKIAFYNETMGKWYHVKSTCDKVQKSVSASLNHLTIFRIVEYTYQGLQTVKVFPNPWKVGTGGNFDIGEMTFKNLPEKGRIRIYNVAGEIVKDIAVTEANDGFYSWDGKNDAGNKVSSGVYIVYVEDDKNNHRIMKIAIIR